MIYLVRHGETVWNAEGRYQGAKDSALTPKGQLQAHAVGRLLKSLADGADLSAAVSPLGRTRETAQAISMHVPLIQTLEPRLAEVSTGSWDGLTEVEIDAEYPASLAGATAFDWFFRSADGETLDAAITRASLWLRDVSGPIVAVSHGLIGRLIRGTYLGLSRRDMLALPVPQDGIFILDRGAAVFVRSEE